MVPGAVGPRPAATMPGGTRTSRFGDIGSGPSPLSNDDFPSLNPGLNRNTTSRPWGSNIWGNNNSLGGLGAAQREASTPRDTDSFYTSPKDQTAEEPKKGSGSLLASSEVENWARQRPAWGTNDSNTSTLSHGRSAGVSPSRSLAHNPSQNNQTYTDLAQTSPAYFPTQRAGSLSHTLKSNGQAQLNPASNAFAIGRHSDSNQNGFGTFGRFNESEGQNQRNIDPAIAPWTEGTTLHSPTDDRRSISNSDYHNTHSTTASRSGSLPPSRHGNDAAPFPRHSDTYPQFAQQPIQPERRNQHATFLPNRTFPERSGSIQSDVALFGRLNQDEDNSDPGLAYHSHRPSVSVNGIKAPANKAMYEALHAREASHSQSNSMYDLYNGRDTADFQNLPRTEGTLANGAGSMTPDGAPNGQYVDHAAQLRNFQFNSNRGVITPGNGDFRSSPFYPAAATPQYSTGATPPAFDHLYPSRNDPSRIGMRQNAFNTSMLDQRLRNIQQQQDPRYGSNAFQPMMGGQFRGQLPYQYQVPNVMLPPNMSMAGVAAMLPTVEPPRGPREQAIGETFRSQCLEDFKANNKTNRRFDLKDVFDHVVEFSGDQHGSRFIQQKLETANSDEKERIFRELKDNSLQLMQDVFGNYVIQKFFEHGDQTQKKQLANRMKGHVLQLSLQMYGCRVVQKALEHILTDQQASLVKELEANVLKCVKDQNGNHVIQKAIERVPAEHIQFIINAFTNQVGALATHPYGCRVIQRMLEHCEEPARSSVLQELHACGTSLISDQYGNYVTQHIIEHGGAEDREKVLVLIKAQLLVFSKHKFASNVVEKALTYGTNQHRRDIMLKLVEKNDRGESQLPSLIKDGYGNYVIQKVLDTLADEDYEQFLDFLRPEMDKAKKVIAGKHVQAVEKKMHRLDKNDTIPENELVNGSSNTHPTDALATATPPPLVSDAQSPQSSSVPSTNNSTAGDPVQIGTSKQPYAHVPELSIATGP